MKVPWGVWISFLWISLSDAGSDVCLSGNVPCDVTVEKRDATTEKPDVTTGKPDVPAEKPDVTEEKPDARTENPDVTAEKRDVTQKQSQSEKRILYWTHFFGHRDFQFGFGRAPFRHAGCPVHNCVATGQCQVARCVTHPL